MQPIWEKDGKTEELAFFRYRIDKNFDGRVCLEKKGKQYYLYEDGFETNLGWNEIEAWKIFHELRTECVNDKSFITEEV